MGDRLGALAERERAVLRAHRPGAVVAQAEDLGPPAAIAPGGRGAIKLLLFHVITFSTSAGTGTDPGGPDAAG